MCNVSLHFGTFLSLSDTADAETFVSSVDWKQIGTVLVIQKIQNFAARLVLLAPRHYHSTPLLGKLHWLPISERTKYKVTCMCFSAINSPGHAYLSELLHVYAPSRALRSSSDTRMLKIQQYKRKPRGFRTLSCFGPHIWNSLPQDLRHCSTLSSFKAKLKTFRLTVFLFCPN